VSRSERFSRARPLKPAQVEQLLKDLSDTTLRDLAGDKVFARGKAYANSGAVQDLEELPPTPDHLLGAQATVYGSEAYSTEIWWLPDDDLGGDCDCPHAQDGFFCKHQVALAWVWRGLLSAAGHGSGSDIASPPHAVKAVHAAARRAQTRADSSEA
jgi:uncharacterized Zn finger protein